MTPPYSVTHTSAALPPHAEERHLSDYLRVVYKRRWVAVPLFLIVFVTCAVNSFRAIPIYEARAQILVEKDTPSVARLNDMFQQQEGWYADDFYQTQYRILQSRSLARRTIAMANVPDGPGAPGHTPVQPPAGLRGVLANSVSAVRNLVGLGSEPAPAAEPRQADETDQQARLTDWLLGSLTVSPVKNTRLVDVRFSSPDPVLAAAIANAHVNAFIQQNLELRFTVSKDATSWLSDQLAEQRKKVEESESALQRYREQHDAVAVEDRQNIVVQKLADLNSAVTRAKTDRIDKEALYNQLKAAQGSAGIDAFPAILSNTYVQSLKGELAELQRQQARLAERYGERHSEMIKIRSVVAATEAKLQAEIGKVVESVRNEFQAAVDRERSLVSALDAQKGEALSLNRKGIEYSVLQREAESNRQIYESLLQRTKESDISKDLKSSNIRVVDAAEVPRAPVLPRRQRDLMMATFGGLLLALGAAFFFEYLDNRIKTPQELRSNLGLAFLGMVPALPSKNGAALITGEVPPSFAEAIKSVRTNVLFSSADEGLKSIAVTSAGPGEGKSAVASNLALSLAQAGLRVLIIDADMRRPRVHDIFGLTDQPGLSNLLVGECRASEAIRQSTTTPSLWILPAGVIPPNPAELLGSKRFDQYLTTLGEQFDWVVIDSPPVLAVADASVLANLASGVVFVVGAEQTTRQAARAAIDQLHAVKARLVGGVLNRASLDRNPYYYSQYYRKEYVRYYAQSPQLSANATRLSARTAGEGRRAKNR